MYAIGILAEEGPNTELAWLLYLALGFFLLMIIVGWLTSRRSAEQAEAGHEAHVHSISIPPDDLTLIEGIGPKVAKVLNEAGIRSFADLAEADAADVQKTLDAAGLQMLNPQGWIEQAKLAAQGDMDGLKKLQGELKGGRKAK
ncbi:MAG: helix-hairpin-helix domain-containing protein [Chloroflexota bacterium]